MPADGKAAPVRTPARSAPSSRPTHPEIAVYVRVNAVATEWFAADVADGVAPEVAGVIVPEARVAGPARRRGRGARATPASATCTCSPGSRPRIGVERARELLRPPVARRVLRRRGLHRRHGRRAHRRRAPRCSTRGPASRWRPGVAGVPRPRPGGHPARRRGRTSSPTPPSDARSATGASSASTPPRSRWPTARSRSSPEEIERARRLLAAYDDAVARGEAAIAFEGQMVDEPLARHARAVLAARRPLS